MWKRQEFAAVLRTVARASRAVLDIYHSAFEVVTKEDATPVTTADLEANRILQQDLRRDYPGIPVVSEESAFPFSGNAPEHFFLVDPIDGTRDFIQRRDEFTVNVALVENGRVIAGAVSAPALGELFWGVEGEGAWQCALFDAHWQHQPVQRCSPRFDPQNPGSALVRVLASVNHRDPRTDALMARLPAWQALQVGSSLKFCRLAQGRADYYPRQMSLHEWDIAAGHAVLKAAGGNVYLSGTREELRYGSAGFSTPCFEAY